MDPGLFDNIDETLASMDIAALMKQFRFFTKTLVILSEEDHPRLNGLSEILKNTEEIEVQNITVKVIPLNNDEIMKAIKDIETFIIVAPENTPDLELIKDDAEENHDKAGFIFTYEAVDEAIKDQNGAVLYYRINHGI